jgi:hypothetical protein
MANPTRDPSGDHTKRPVDLAAESVAGEEDPGASIDTAMAPADQAPPGTPGTGENVCPQCGGSGRAGTVVCPACEGRGTVTTGIGGA